MKAVGLLIAFLALFSVSPVFAEGGTAAAADLAALRVSVVSPVGDPIFGAEVIIQPIASADGVKLCFASSFAGRRTLSPAADNFFSGKVNPGTYRMEILAEGRQTGKVEKVVVGAGEERELEIALEPGHVIAGRVTDEDGRPLAGARLNFSSPEFSSAFTKTGPEGRFEISSLAEGVYRLGVSLSGYAGVNVWNVATGTKDLELAMSEGRVIRGILAGDTEVPGRRVGIHLKRSDSRGSSTWHRHFSLDEDKHFTIADLKAGSYDLRLREGDYLSDWSMNIESSPPDQAEPVRLTVYRGASLSGRVLDRRSGRPLTGVVMSLTRPVGWATEASKTTDDEGRYEMRPLPPGEYLLRGRLRGDSFSRHRIEKSVALAAGDELTGMDFEIDAGREVSFSGAVVGRTDEPIAGAKVGLHVRRTPPSLGFRDISVRGVETDADGRFSFAGYLEEGAEIRLSAEKDGFAFGESESVFLSLGQSEVSGLTVRLDSGATLRVTAADEDGRPLPGVVVELRHDWSPGEERIDRFEMGSLKRVTDSSGGCLFDRLNPRRYRLAASGRGYAPVEKRFELEEGEAQKTVALKMAPGRTLRVLVRDRRGSPVAGAVVAAHQPRIIQTPFDDQNRSDSSGLCLIEDLPRGPLRLDVSAEGYSPVRRLRVGADQNEVEVVLGAAGAITGRLLGPDGTGLKEFRLLARQLVDLPADRRARSGVFFRPVNLGEGRFILPDMTPGLYDLEIRIEGLALKIVEEVEVEAGRETEIGARRLEAEGIISGRVVDATNGSPLPRSRVMWEGGPIIGQPGHDGRFELRGLPAGVHALRIFEQVRHGKRVEGVRVASGEKKEIGEVALEPMTSAEIEERDRAARTIPSLGVVRKRTAPDSPRPDRLEVEEVLPGSAAEQAGLAAGDAIVGIGGVFFADDPLLFSTIIAGEPGTALTLTVRRKETGREEEVRLTIGEWDREEWGRAWFGL